MYGTAGCKSAMIDHSKSGGRQSTMKWSYDIVLQTHLGERHGSMTLDVAGSIITGVCKLLGYETKCEGTISEHGNCVLRGEIRTFMSAIPFTGKGTADEEHISLTLHTGKDQLNLFGNSNKFNEGEKLNEDLRSQVQCQSAGEY